MLKLRRALAIRRRSGPVIGPMVHLVRVRGRVRVRVSGIPLLHLPRVRVRVRDRVGVRVRVRVGPMVHLPRPLADHGLDREDVPHLHRARVAAVAEVKDVGRRVEGSADAVAAELRHLVGVGVRVRVRVRVRMRVRVRARTPLPR